MNTDVDRSVLTLPRAQWAQHPRYPTQTLLLGGHRNFRMISDVLVKRSERGGDTAAIRMLYAQWKMMMRHGHEAYEEQKLFPYLEARWGISVDALRAGHEALHVCEKAVWKAFDNSPQAASSALAEALRVHDAVLNTHLDLEESIVIPALLALSPEEFQDYANSSIHRLLNQLSA